MALTSLKSRSGRKDKSKSSKRKLEKRLQFHAKVQGASSSLGAKQTINKKKRLRQRQKKLKAYDLSALSEFLPDLGSSQNPADTTHMKLSCKSRQNLLQRESAQMRAVLNNSMFQMDPIAAIQRHLESTQHPSAPTHQEGKHNKQGRRKRRWQRLRKALNHLCWIYNVFIYIHLILT